MKRIISILLTAAMLLALITAPMMVTANAAEWTAPTGTITNTSDVFNTDFHFYAIKGTPTVDGTKEAAWNNAYTLRMEATRRVNSRANIPFSVMNNVYVMWDANNIYILEEYEYDTPVYAPDLQNNWTSGKDCSLYYVVLPNDMTKDASKLGAVNMIHAAPGDVSQITGNTKAVASNVFGRERAYTTTTIDPTNTSASVGSAWTYSDAALAERYAEGVTSYTSYTANGWMLETAISWDLLDYHNVEEFIPTLGTEIGFLVNSNDGSGNGSYYTPTGDHIGFSVLELVETNPTETLIPDLTWINDPNCITDDGYYMISDAADLYGMALLSLGHGSYTDFSTLGLTVGAGKAFAGKKFRIMNDIDLNPGWDVNGTEAPDYCWPVINFFANAEIDGNGKTISGLYAARGTSYSDYTDGHGFIGRLGANSYIHDLTFTNGKIIGDDGDNVGTIGGLVNSNSTGGNTRLVNIYSDLTLGGASGKVGGIIGGNWTGGSNAHNVLIENCVFTGTANYAICGQGKSGATLITQKNNYSTIATNKTTIEASDAVYIQFTDVVDGKCSVRILAGIDSLNPKNVGFDITIVRADQTTITETFTTDTVYESIKAAGLTVSAKNAIGHDYVYALVIENIPADEPIQLKVTPFRTMNGGKKAVSTVYYENTYLNGEILPDDAA